MDDPQQPGHHTPLAAEAGRRVPDGQQCVLHHVLGLGRVPGQAQGVGVHPLTIRRVELTQGLVFLGRYATHQFDVVLQISHRQLCDGLDLLQSSETIRDQTGYHRGLLHPSPLEFNAVEP